MRRYGEVAERAARLAASLRNRLLLQPGERVAIVAKNCPDYLELMFGIWHAGAVVVPANAKLHGREVGYILQHSGARVCFASSELRDEVAAHAPATLEYLIAIGGPQYQALFTADPIAPGDVLLHAAPMSHGSGLYMMAHVARLGIHVVPESSSFDAAEVLRLLDAWPRTSMFAAPTMVKRLVECNAECNPDHIRTIIWGGAPRPALCANLRSGREPDDDHDPVEAGDRRSRPSPLG